MTIPLAKIGTIIVLLTISTPALFPIARATDTYLVYQTGDFLYECKQPYD